MGKANRDAPQWLNVSSVSDAEALARRKKITHLTISRTKDSDVGPLGKLPHLTHLSFVNCSRVVDLSCLKDSKLVELTLHNTPASNDLAWIKGFDSLETLGLYGSMSGVIHGKKAGTIRTLAPLAELPRLELISLGGVRIEKSGLNPLAKLSALRQLQFGRSVIDAKEVEKFVRKRSDVEISH